MLRSPTGSGGPIQIISIHYIEYIDYMYVCMLVISPCTLKTTCSENIISTDDWPEILQYTLVLLYSANAGISTVVVLLHDDQSSTNSAISWLAMMLLTAVSLMKTLMDEHMPPQVKEA